MRAAFQEFLKIALFILDRHPVNMLQNHAQDFAQRLDRIDLRRFLRIEQGLDFGNALVAVFLENRRQVFLHTRHRAEKLRDDALAFAFVFYA